MKNKKKKLLIATDNFVPRRDGVVRFLTEILPRIKKEFDITIICPDNEKLGKTYEGIKLVKISLSKRKVNDFQVPKFKPFLITKEVSRSNIVFSQTLGPIGATSLFFAQRMLKKNISFIHSIEWELAPKSFKNKFLKKIAYYLSNLLTKFLYSRNNALIIPSENISEHFVWKKIMTPRKIIHLGVDTNKFIPLEKNIRNSKRAELGIEEKDIVIGYHGRLSREKDVFTIVRAFVKIRRENPNLKLLIIGDGVFRIIKSIKKQPGVIYLPAVEDVEKYVPLMDIYCLASLTETTSLSVLEAMSCEVPVISTPVGFVKDYIKFKKTGLFFRIGDSFDLAKKITYLISHEDLREEIGKNSRKMVIERFSWDKTAEQISVFLNELGEKHINEIDEK